MPLTWDSTACADLDCENSDDDVTLRHVAIFATMAVGINHVKEDNVKDFYTRISFWEKLNGAYRNAYDGEEDGAKAIPHPFTIADVYRIVGLRTNASPMTKAQFYKNAYSAHERYATPYKFPTREEALEKESSETLAEAGSL